MSLHSLAKMRWDNKHCILRNR